MTARITFYGGAGEVTGANFLLDTDSTSSPQAGKKILIDCGARERENICDPRNHEPFPYDVKAIDALVVTHAHQDHIGLIPKLAREGFRGTIYSTAATKEISAIMFDDALSIMESDAERSGCGVLYEEKDVKAALSLWKTHEYHEPFALGDITVELFDAGHILGSAMAKFSRLPAQAGGGTSVLFTGDLGNSPEPLLNDTESPAGVTYLVMESVYGDRVHEDRAERREILRAAIEGARERGGTLLMPCFSLERTQIILYEIHNLIEEKKMQPIPVYLDAPLAERVSAVYRAHLELLNPKAREEFSRGDAFTFPKLAEMVTGAQSHHVHRKADPKVIIAGAGMSNGGRIRFHEKAYLPDPRAGILLTGYQAPGSLGRRIRDGEREVRIDHDLIRVRAWIGDLTGYSGHKDRDALLDFVESAAKTAEGSSPDASQSEAFRGESLKKVFVVMGEPGASAFLAQRVRDFLGVDTAVPQRGDSAEITL